MVFDSTFTLSPRFKKYADKEDWNETRKKQVRKSRVMDSVKPIIDQWLKEDLKKKKKFRRTAKRIFNQLEDEYDFTGAERTVRDYVSHRKIELIEETGDAALPLEAKQGTAQVDYKRWWDITRITPPNNYSIPFF
jgi:transposase